MKKVIAVLVLFVFALAVNLDVLAAPINIPSDCSYILMDAKTGQVIVESNADVKRRPASTTKMMTAVVAMEKAALDMPMKVSLGAVNDIGPGGMNIGIMAGEEGFTLENMLDVMLIRSANETANIIAENVAGSRKEFVQMMNERAAELGAKNTNFVNPCGKDDRPEEQYHLTTARDLAIIARHAMTLPKFREIVKKEYCDELPVTNKHSEWPPIRSTNKLIWPTNKYPYTVNGEDGNYVVTGTKTGYTNAAGNNLVSSAVSDDGLELIAVVMHVTEISDNRGVFSYTKDLFKYGYENFASQKIADAGKLVKTIDVQDAKDDAKLDLITDADFICPLPLDKSEHNVETTEFIQQSIKAPVTKGDIMGAIEYKRNGILLGKVNVIAAQDIEKSLKAKILEYINKLAKDDSYKYPRILLAAAIAFLILRFILKTISRRRKKSNYKL